MSRYLGLGGAEASSLSSNMPPKEIALGLMREKEITHNINQFLLLLLLLYYALFPFEFNGF